MVKDYLLGIALISIHLEKLSTHLATFLFSFEVLGKAMAKSILTVWKGYYPLSVGV